MKDSMHFIKVRFFFTTKDGRDHNPSRAHPVVVMSWTNMSSTVPCARAEDLEPSIGT